MVWYDFVILAILIYTTWSGLQRGLINQLAWIAALVLCFKFSDKLAPMLEPKLGIEDPSVRHGAAMLILYVGFSLGSFMVARIIESWMQKAKLKDFDRHMGGLLGFVKGIVLALVVTYFAVTIGPTKEAVLKSKTGSLACDVLDKVEPITPDYFHDYFKRMKDNLGHDTPSDIGSEAAIGELFSEVDRASEEAEQGGGFGSLISDWVGQSNSTDTGDPNSDAPLWQGGGGSSEPDVTQGPSFDQFLRSLPQDLRQRAEAQVKERWNASTPDERRSLIKNVTQSFSDQVPEILGHFLGRGSNSQPNSGTTPNGNTLDSVLALIADEYRAQQFPNADSIPSTARRFLTGVPADVQRTVISDWYADMSGRGPDPDPQTVDNTPLDIRIIRQLNNAGIPVRSLQDASLRSRLNSSMR